MNPAKNAIMTETVEATANLVPANAAYQYLLLTFLLLN